MYEVTNIYFHCHGFIQYSWHVTKWQFYNQNDSYAEILKYSNMGFTGMFSVETVLKIVAYGVKVSTQTRSLDWHLTFLKEYVNKYKCTLSVINRCFVYLHDCMGLFPAE